MNQNARPNRPSNRGISSESAGEGAGLSAAETRLAELDAAVVRERELRPWQFGLRQAMVLLGVVAIYLGISRSMQQWLFGLPGWVDVSAGVVIFIWLIVLTVRTGSRLGSWRQGRRRQQARREALSALVDEKRASHRKQSDSAASD